MAAVRQSSTKPELQLRSAIHKLGGRFRLSTTARLPGRPDILFITARVAVFVDGCFWHGCPIHGTSPKTNAGFWSDKIATNKARDTRVDSLLREQGWAVIRVWEHEVKSDAVGTAQKVMRRVQRRSQKHGTE